MWFAQIRGCTASVGAGVVLGLLAIGAAVEKPENVQHSQLVGEGVVDGTVWLVAGSGWTVAGGGDGDDDEGGRSYPNNNTAARRHQRLRYPYLHLLLFSVELTIILFTPLISTFISHTPL